MQATVLDFDASTTAGHIVFDDGHALPFEPAAFAASGLRLLRPGQRVRVELSDQGDVTSVTIATLP
jgi:cold shock CspA family protein